MPPDPPTTLCVICARAACATWAHQPCSMCAPPSSTSGSAPVNVQVYTDIKLDDYDKHVQTDCKDHSTSKVPGHSDQTTNKPYFNLWTGSYKSRLLAQVIKHQIMYCVPHNALTKSQLHVNVMWLNKHCYSNSHISGPCGLINSVILVCSCFQSIVDR